MTSPEIVDSQYVGDLRPLDKKVAGVWEAPCRCHGRYAVGRGAAG